MTHLSSALSTNFLGDSPDWYKKLIIAFLIINPVLFALQPFVAGWVLVLQFIFTLAMALKCYPLQPGGLLAIEALLIGMTTPDALLYEVLNNFKVLLLLIFMVAGIHFMRELLLFVFTRLLIGIKSKMILSLMFSFAAAFLSAFLDALTVTAVLISVSVGFYTVYYNVIHKTPYHHNTHKDEPPEEYREDMQQFLAFLRSLMMHGAVGTALGGVCTIVGEPQNLLIAEKMGWTFMEFFIRMVPITMPVLVAGLICCALLEKTKWFGYGAQLPDSIRTILSNFQAEKDNKQTQEQKAALMIQAIVGIILIISLALHIAEVGIIGLMVIVLLTAFNGITQEHKLGHAFEEALPFTALLVVFFAIVAVIESQHLFVPVIDWVFSFPMGDQPLMFFVANALLSMISDNVFVATVYINEVSSAFKEGLISREHYDLLAVAINTGTNIPSIATPNGQAAFLFLLTSSLAPLIKLDYVKMMWMALPYTIIMTTVAIISMQTLL